MTIIKYVSLRRENMIHELNIDCSTHGLDRISMPQQ